MNSIKLEAGDVLHYRILNARMIEVFTNSLSLKTELDTFNNITSITIGSLVLKPTEKFITNDKKIPSYYTLCKIEEGASPNNKFRHKFTLFSHLRNKTTDYILPCLGRNATYFDVDGYLVNAYLDKEYKLKLMYRFASTSYYDKLENLLLNHPRFIEVDSTIPGFDVFIYSIPEHNWNDVELFKKGKYSKLSKALKFNIKNFYGLKDKSNLWRILTKDEALIKEKELDLMLPKGILNTVDLDEKPKKKEEYWIYNCIT